MGRGNLAGANLYQLKEGDRKRVLQDKHFPSQSDANMTDGDKKNKSSLIESRV